MSQIHGKGGFILSKITDNDYYDLFTSTPLSPNYHAGDAITYLNHQNSLLHIPVGAHNPCDMGRYSYSSFPALYTQTSTIGLEQSGVSAVQNNPDLSLFGGGVLVAVIDTGIDYTHPAFRNEDGTTRILSIWDQTMEAGTIPEAVTFGSEYEKEEINIALHSENPLSIVPTTDSNGHGTAIASILAGSPGEEVDFQGVAPRSEYIIVKLKEAKENLKAVFFVPQDKVCYQESDLILGARYAISKAEQYNRPMVICIAMGSNHGGHTGSGPLSDYLDYLSLLPGIGVSVSAGNEGNTQRHYYNETLSPPYYHNAELKIGEKDTMFSMELWSFSPARLTIDISSPNRESTHPIFPAIHQCKRSSFIFHETTIYVNNIIFEEKTGDQLILLRFSKPLPGIWQLRIQADDEEPFAFHGWLPSGDLISNETFFLHSNPDTTITSPGNTKHSLTVTAYNQNDDSILPTSSRGYTRTGDIKPDIASPGFRLTCASPGNLYTEASGTGVSAAFSAGIIAMVFEWAIVRENYVRITGNDVNRLIIRGASRNPSYSYPNRIWGYGQVDVNHLLEQLLSPYNE